MEGGSWQEIRLRGEHKEYIFHDLQCGTKYYCYIVAVNSAGYGNGSETISVKTDGSGKPFVTIINIEIFFKKLSRILLCK